MVAAGRGSGTAVRSNIGDATRNTRARPLSSTGVEDSSDRLGFRLPVRPEADDVCLVDHEPLIGETGRAFASAVTHERLAALEAAVVGSQQLFLGVGELDWPVRASGC